MARRKDLLKEYKDKRDFEKTPEPSGGKGPPPPAKSPERFFCVQKHLASQLHYDFRLEHNGVLLSWAVPKGPSLNPKDKRLAMQVEDHPLEYGQFEGVIPEGYGAGIVMLWDTGTWEPDDESICIDDALKKGQLKFQLHGYKLKGSWVLIRTKGPMRGQGSDKPSWLLIKHKDFWSGPVDVTAAAPRSVKTDRELAEILAAEEPDVWPGQRPAEGRVAGKALREVMLEAGQIRRRP